MQLIFTETQIGEGDLAIVGRIMSRLTMAKVLEKLGHNMDEFIFKKDSSDRYSYYTNEDAFNDIEEFLSLSGVDYEVDFDSKEIVLKCTESKFLNLEEAFNPNDEWAAFDEPLEDEEFKMIEYIEGYGILIRLSYYSGFPIRFFKTMYEFLGRVK